MKFMTDAHLANVSRHLNSKGINCETVHKMMKGNEDSSVQIDDWEIVRFLQDQRSRGVRITLICNDKDLAGHSGAQDLPVIFIADLVLTHVKDLEASGYGG